MHADVGGVVQRTILSHFLFYLYCSDIPELITILCKLGDDTLVISHVEAKQQ